MTVNPSGAVVVFEETFVGEVTECDLSAVASEESRLAESEGSSRSISHFLVVAAQFSVCRFPTTGDFPFISGLGADSNTGVDADGFDARADAICSSSFSPVLRFFSVRPGASSVVLAEVLSLFLNRVTMSVEPEEAKATGIPA